MSKVRVYELARELKIDTKILATRMKSIGIEVQTHQATLTSEQVEKIKRLVLEGAGGDAEKKDTGSAPKVIRRQRRPEAPLEAAASDMPQEAAPATPAAIPTPAIAAEPVFIASVPEPTPPPTAQAVAAPVVTRPTPEPEPETIPVEAVQAEAALPPPAQVPAPIPTPPTTPAHSPAHPVEAKAPATGSTLDNQPTANDAVRRRVQSGGATIVRRATPEELAAAAQRAAQQQQQQQQRDGFRSRAPLRSEDSRGMRVTNPFGQTGAGGAATRFGASSGPQPGPVPSTPPPGMSMDVWEDERRRERDKKRLEEEEEARQKAGAKLQKVKRASSVSTRVLLRQIDEVISSEEDPALADLPGPAGDVIIPDPYQNRTVYTPSAPQRRNNSKDIRRRKDLKRTQITTPRAAYRVVTMGEQITVADLAQQMSIKASELIKKLMAQGVMATMNANLDHDTAALMATEYGFEVKSEVKTIEDILGKAPTTERPVGEDSRPPIVTVMGHVDHGKTSILDAIRLTEVAAGEAGGITQHIGAYTVHHRERTISFLDTPGHEAFSSMRARGASLTDIVVLVVAADDGVMPQTKEAISHAREAKVPMIVAINKIDKPQANFDRVYRELMEVGVQSEEWGGDTQFVKVSALKKIGLDDLLEAIVLQSDVLELKCNNDAPAAGVVVEAHLDPGRGAVATVMVKNGTLRVGDQIVAGVESGRVRAMLDHLGRKVTEATPATPVLVLGLSGVPQAGDKVDAVADEKTAREAVSFRMEEKRNRSQGASSAQSLQDLLGKIKTQGSTEVALIVKGDTQGSVEAVSESISKVVSAKIANRIVHRAVGGVTESDVALAAAAKAIIIAFNVRAARGIDESAERAGVPIKYFSIIYDVVDAVKALMAGQLPPVVKEVVQGHAEVRQTIQVPKVGLIAGSAVTDGKIMRSSHVRLIRDNIVIYTGKIGSLRRFKDDVKEVQQGYECGIGVEGYQDVKIGDVVEAFMLEESAATLDG